MNINERTSLRQDKNVVLVDEYQSMQPGVYQLIDFNQINGVIPEKNMLIVLVVNLCIFTSLMKTHV